MQTKILDIKMRFVLSSMSARHHNFFCFQENVRKENEKLMERLAAEKERRKKIDSRRAIKRMFEGCTLMEQFYIKFKDSTRMGLPPEMRNYIEQKLNIRNLLGAHPHLEDDDG